MINQLPSIKTAPVVMGLLFLLFSGSLLHAGERETFQGVIVSYNPVDNMMVVNERPVLITPNTQFLNHKELRTSRLEWVPGKWVFVVGESSPRGILADKLFLLPHRVKTAEITHYPFMSGDDEESEK
jgi:hypothetical protein